METLALMTGIDIPVPELQFAIHQPTIKEISMIGEKDFFIGAQTLCLNKSLYIQDETLLSQTTNFQIFMTMMQNKESVITKECVLRVLQLIIPNAQVLFTPRAVMLNLGDHSVNIDESNFETLQAILKDIFCLKESGQEAFNPANEEAKKIAEKLMRGRQRVAAQKAKEGGDSIFTQYLSILTVGLESMGLKDLMDLTVFQLYDLVERYMLYSNWDLDVRQRLAGGKPDSEPDNWMKPIH
jgi:hypothetical protein